ncbi:hypothetical protein EV385_3431 [Krasilnikovia cinnamomea]|uniref:Excreted virulence factor EspC (Type VII ESX diderm) n=1 Tax=Krasilnikovia cinnamomea TaxID=349313 RepID=A0A4Q7ZKX3_9ACTN|nr:hypothetical protein [Krasilnikovia cinnamomea]RZU51600.1 hypothetical protein EV385_3431 [Krasilnikovia cinnamomea]
MADGTDVDLAALDALAARLRTSGDNLDTVGNGAPGIPDAGELSGAMGELIAHLSEGAGNLVVGLKEAADRVELSRRGYAERDAGVAQTFAGYF